MFTTKMSYEDSRMKYLYLHNEDVVTKQCRGMAPMAVNGRHVKHYVGFTLK